MEEDGFVGNVAGVSVAFGFGLLSVTEAYDWVSLTTERR